MPRLCFFLIALSINGTFLEYSYHYGMKKIILLVLIAMIWGQVSFAQSQFSPMISRIEMSVIGIDYSSQTDAARLDRIEKEVYGTTSSDQVSARLEKLKKDLSADLIGKEISPTEDTFADQPLKADSSVSYPIVDKMEMQIFSRDYKNLEINQRVANLEQKVLKKSYADDNLNSRVERLKGKLMPETVATSKPSYSMEPSDFYSENFPSDENYFTPKQNEKTLAQDYNKNPSVLDNVPNTSDFRSDLSNLEQSLFKKSYANEPANTRIARVEQKLFGTTFDSEDTSSRVYRAKSASRAQASSGGYDNNKITKHLNTALQLLPIVIMILAFVL